MYTRTHTHTICKFSKVSGSGVRVRGAGEDEGVGCVGHEPLAAGAVSVNLWFHHFCNFFWFLALMKRKWTSVKEGFGHSPR